MKHWRSFSLRSLIVVVTLIAAGLGLWTRARHFRVLAARHHLAAMDFGYAAGAIQRPVDLEWEWKHPSPLKMDRAAVVEAAPFWRRSRYHAQVRDIYLAAASRPWLPAKSLPPFPAPVPPPTFPECDVAAAVQTWWKEQFGAYVEANPCFLEAAMGFPPGDPNLDLTRRLLSDEQFTHLANRFQQRRGHDAQFDRIRVQPAE